MRIMYRGVGSLCVLFAVVAVGECRDGSSEEGSCRYLCPQKGSRDKFYCCEKDALNSGRELKGDKDRQCPPERATCPRIHDTASKAPNDCKKDADCRDTEMCCFDSCLKHRTCSIPLGHSTGGHHRPRRGLRAGRLDFGSNKPRRPNAA